MPQLEGAGRTKTVRTETTEQIPVDEGRSEGLGMPWQEYLASIGEDELANTTIYIYRRVPETEAGFCIRLGGQTGPPCERIDEAWIQERAGLGGGTYDIAIRNKNGKSRYERNVKIAGAPKLLSKNNGSPESAAPPGPPPSADNSKLIDLLERVMLRLEERTTPAPSNGTLDTDLSRLDKLAGLFGLKPQGGGDGELEHLFKKAMLEKLLGRNDIGSDLERLKQLKDIIGVSTPGSTRSLAEQLTDIMGVAELLGLRRGEGKTTLTDIAAMLVEKAPEIAQRLTQFAGAMAAARQPRGPAAPGSPGPMAPAEILSPSVPGGANARPATVPASPPAAVPTSTNGPLRMAPLQSASAAAPAGGGEIDPALEKRLAELIEEEWDGGAIVDWLLGCQQDPFVQLLGQFPEDAVTGFLASRTFLGAATQLPQWPRILAEAKAYIRDNADAELEERGPDGKPRVN